MRPRILLFLRGLNVFLWLLVAAEVAFFIFILVPPFDKNTDLLAGLLGAVAVITAAWIAWIAVQVQIDADTQRIENERRETFGAAIELLSPILADVSAIWRAADIVYERRQGDLMPEASLLMAVATENSPDEISLSRLEIVAQGLSPAARVQFDVVVQYIRIFYRETNTRLRGKTVEAIRSWDALFVRTFGSHLREACVRCDARLAAVFEGRIRAPVNWNPLSDSKNAFLDTYLAEHPNPE